MIDLGPFLAGAPDSLERTAGQLRHAMENVGFYFIVNHGVPQQLVERTFQAAQRFHAQPLEGKLKLKIDENIVGYLPMQGATVRHSAINTNNKPNLNEAFFINRQLTPEHPDVVAKKPFRVLNRWPEDLPSFREDVMAYVDAMEQLGRKLMPLYAIASTCPRTISTKPFASRPMRFACRTIPRRRLFRTTNSAWPRTPTPAS